MEFKERVSNHPTRRKLYKLVEGDNGELVRKDPYLVEIERDDALEELEEPGTLISAENLNKGNWRDETSMSFEMLKDGDPDPKPSIDKTQIFTRPDGTTWLLAPGAAVPKEIGAGTKVVINETPETQIEFTGDPQKQIDTIKSELDGYANNVLRDFTQQGQQIKANEIEDDAVTISKLGSDVKEQIGDRILKNQGTTNANKVLGIDDDGNVKPTPIMSMPLGTVFSAIRTDIPVGCVRLDGFDGYQQLNFPDFYAILVRVDNPLGAIVGSSYPTESDANKGKIWVNTTAQTFRVPKLTAGDVITNSADGLNPSNLGEYSKGGLPNITGAFGTQSVAYATVEIAEGAISGANTGINDQYTGNSSNTRTKAKFNFDASRQANGNNPDGIYGASDKVIPSHIKYPYFMVVSNSVPEASQADWNNFVGQLTSKLNNSGWTPSTSDNDMQIFGTDNMGNIILQPLPVINGSVGADFVTKIEKIASGGSGNQAFTNAIKRTWKSGKIEIELIASAVGSGNPINNLFAIPFGPLPSASYRGMAIMSGNYNSTSISMRDVQIFDKTTSTFGFVQHSSGVTTDIYLVWDN